MLQFIARENNRFSVPELVQMAIEGGCAWIVLDPGEMSDSAIREMAVEIIPLCKETSTILTMVDHADMAKELGIHGVLLQNDTRSAAELREMFGPEAIIGVEIGSLMEAMGLRGVDVDYAQFAPGMNLDGISRIVKDLRSEGESLPLVYAGDAPISDLGAVMVSGVSGVAISKRIAEAEDPVKATEQAIAILKLASEK